MKNRLLTVIAVLTLTLNIMSFDEVEIQDPPEFSNFVVDTASFKILEEGSVLYSDSSYTDSSIVIKWEGTLSYSVSDDENDSMGIWAYVVIDSQTILVDSMWGDYIVASGNNNHNLNFTFTVNHHNWGSQCNASVKIIADDINLKFPTKVYYANIDTVKSGDTVIVTVNSVEYPYGSIDSITVDTTCNGGIASAINNSVSWTVPTLRAIDYETPVNIIFSDAEVFEDILTINVELFSPVLQMKLIDTGSYINEFSITKTYYMDSTEITQGFYDMLMSDATYGYSAYSKPNWNSNNGLGENFPVYNVNWFDAVLFCNARSKVFGFDTVYTYSSISGIPGNNCVLTEIQTNYNIGGFRLPSEDEWELAYRGGTSTDYYWNKNYNPYPSTASDNLEVNSYTVWNGSVASGTYEVASKLPNANFLYDMSGNLWEWCGDWHGARSTPRTDYTGPANGTNRYIRGGGYASSASYLQASSRIDSEPEYKCDSYGFRCVLPLSN